MGAKGTGDTERVCGRRSHPPTQNCSALVVISKLQPVHGSGRWRRRAGRQRCWRRGRGRAGAGWKHYMLATCVCAGERCCVLGRVGKCKGRAGIRRTLSALKKTKVLSSTPRSSRPLMISPTIWSRSSNDALRFRQPTSSRPAVYASTCPRVRRDAGKGKRVGVGGRAAEASRSVWGRMGEASRSVWGRMGDASRSGWGRMGKASRSGWGWSEEAISHVVRLAMPQIYLVRQLKGALHKRWPWPLDANVPHACNVRVLLAIEGVRVSLAGAR